MLLCVLDFESTVEIVWYFGLRKCVFLENYLSLKIM